MSAKKQYNILLKNGILLELYDTMTGIWLEDKHEFERIYEAEESFTNNIETEFDEYGEF